MPIVEGKPPQALNELLIETKSKIFEWIKFEHQSRFSKDSKIKDDPVVISCNVYNLTMHFCIGLMTQVMNDCLEMQAKYEEEKKK